MACKICPRTKKRLCGEEQDQCLACGACEAEAEKEQTEKPLGQ